MTARVVAPTAAWSRPRPSHPLARLEPQTAWSSQPQVLLVLRSAWVAGREWLRVLLPVRPAGVSGWIRRDNVVLGRSPYWVEVHLRERRVVAFRAGRQVRSFGAVVGRAATPTPTGLAAVYERNKQADPRGFFGPWVLSLTSLSPVLESFGGGPGRIAIHGRGGASFSDPLGSAASHGCIRVPNVGIRWLAANVPPGTPVRIYR